MTPAAGDNLGSVLATGDGFILVGSPRATRDWYGQGVSRQRHVPARVHGRDGEFGAAVAVVGSYAVIRAPDDRTTARCT